MSAAEARLAFLGAASPGNPRSAMVASRLAERRGARSEAERLVNLALVTAPGDATAWERRADLRQTDHRNREALADYERALELKPNDPRLVRKVMRGRRSRGDFERAHALLGHLDGNNGEAARIEHRAATAAKNRHPRRAADLYAQAIDVEPNELAHRFGWAAALVNADDLAGADAAYAAILKVEPANAFARSARDRIAALSRDRLRVSYLFTDERSADRLADVARSVFAADYTVVFAPSVRFTLGPRTWIESPGGGGDFISNGESLALSWKVRPALEIAGDFIHKNYLTGDLPDTFTGGIDAAWRALDEFELRVAARQTDVLPNRDAFEQGIQATVLRLGFRSPLSARLEVSGSTAWRFFSDDNVQNESEAAAEWTFSQRPGRFVVGLRATYLTTRFVTLDPRHAGTEGPTEHPYWTPQDYLRGALAARWEQDLFTSPNDPVGPFGYRLGLRTSFDTDDNPSLTGWAGLRGRFTDGLETNLSVEIERSEQWQSTSAFASVTYAF